MDIGSRHRPFLVPSSSTLATCSRSGPAVRSRHSALRQEPRSPHVTVIWKVCTGRRRIASRTAVIPTDYQRPSSSIPTSSARCLHSNSSARLWKHAEKARRHPSTFSCVPCESDACGRALVPPELREPIVYGRYILNKVLANFPDLQKDALVEISP